MRPAISGALLISALSLLPSCRHHPVRGLDEAQASKLAGLVEAGRASPGCLDPEGGLRVGSQTRELVHDGERRRVRVHAPRSYDGREPLPLVFDFHPLRTRARVQDMLSGTRVRSEREGFIVVQPDGLGRSWNAGPACCAPARERGVDDLGLFLALLAELEREACVDPSRVYAQGMSNGGYLAHRLGCEFTEKLAAIGPVAASIPIADCSPSEPLPVLMVSGTKDKFRLKQASFVAWAAFNECRDQPELSARHGDFECWTHDECAGGVEVSHCVGEGVGHCWPDPYRPILPCSRDYATGDELWNFFERWTRSPAQP